MSSTLSWKDALKNRFAQPRLNLGLALGSSQFIVTTADQRISYPTRIAVHQDRSQAIAFGLDALELLGREPEGVRVIQPVQGSVVTDQKLATLLLSKTLTVLRSGLRAPGKAAIAIPSNLSAVESQTLISVIKAAGTSDIYLIEQTLAAAVGAGRHVLKPRGHLVIHAGAGSIHSSLICLATPMLSHSTRTAGDHLTGAIKNYVRTVHNLHLDWMSAEQIKFRLGSALRPGQEETFTISGQDATLGKPAERTLTSLEIYEVLAPKLDKIATDIRRLIAKIPPTLLEDVHQDGILLSGGMAKFRGLADFLSQETRLKVVIPQTPEDKVTLGLQLILKRADLRQAILGQRDLVAHSSLTPSPRGTGLVGALVLSAGLALGVQGFPSLGLKTATTVANNLTWALTPSSPLSSIWDLTPPQNPVMTSSFFQYRDKELQQDNDRLRKLLKAPLMKTAYEPIVADVVARDPRGWLSTLSLNVGTQQGAEPGMIVTDGTQLVGQVSIAGPNLCQVQLISDGKTAIACRIPHTRGSGVVLGSPDGSLELRYLDPDSGVKTGDWVVTSGLDHHYPAGLRVGWVQRLSRTSGQATMIATLMPAMNVHQLQNVLVLRRVQR